MGCCRDFDSILTFPRPYIFDTLPVSATAPTRRDEKGERVGVCAENAVICVGRKKIKFSYLRLEKFKRRGGHSSGDSDVLEGNISYASGEDDDIPCDR